MDLEVKEMLVFDITDSCEYLNVKDAKYFTPPPSGVYRTGRYQPSLLTGNTYQLSDGNSFFYNGVIDSIKEDIYNEYGVLLVKYSELNTHYNEFPDVGYTQRLFIIDSIKETIHLSCQHNETPGYDTDSHIRDEYDKQETIKYLCKKIMPLIDQLLNFIGSDSWNIYTVEEKGNVIYVLKHTDYRIVQWYRHINSNGDKLGSTRI